MQGLTNSLKLNPISYKGSLPLSIHQTEDSLEILESSREGFHPTIDPFILSLLTKEIRDLRKSWAFLLDLVAPRGWQLLSARSAPVRDQLLICLDKFVKVWKSSLQGLPQPLVIGNHIRYDISRRIG